MPHRNGAGGLGTLPARPEEAGQPLFTVRDAGAAPSAEAKPEIKKVDPLQATVKGGRELLFRVDFIQGESAYPVAIEVEVNGEIVDSAATLLPQWVGFTFTPTVEIPRGTEEVIIRVGPAVVPVEGRQARVETVTDVASIDVTTTFDPIGEDRVRTALAVGFGAAGGFLAGSYFDVF